MDGCSEEGTWKYTWDDRRAVLKILLLEVGLRMKA